MASPAITQQTHGQGLPSISSLTNGLPGQTMKLSPEQASLNEPSRDSGTWPPPQSKCKSAFLLLLSLVKRDSFIIV